MRFLLVCSFTLLLVPLVNSKNPRNAPGRTTNIPGIGKLIFYRRGAGLKLIRRGGQLDVKIAKLQAGNRVSPCSGYKLKYFFWCFEL